MAGVDVNYAPRGYLTPLCVAVSRGIVDAVKKLIKTGADLNVGKLDHTPLYLAAMYGHIECVNELIQAGADLNTADENGNTPLMAAAQKLSNDCVSTLLKAGAELDMTYLAFMAMVTSFTLLQNSEGTVHNTY